ncbi:aegerolysin family protein [Photobacterium sp. MCCC 1A19761]|uniref:aegerolysin family protein n=1 Tax=Photobacterium sp. MCCC 1A19761 TaxID=3115000 RepID=UPI00307D0088
MAYAQNIQIAINPENFTLTVDGAKLEWGKFYEYDDKDSELSIKDVNGTKIEPKEIKVIAACGRSDSASGTEGSIKLYDGNVEIGKFYWDCPWGSKDNQTKWEKSNNQYITEVSGGNLHSGAIGLVNITVYKKN